jgi:hypothetical protein
VQDSPRGRITHISGKHHALVAALHEAIHPDVRLLLVTNTGTKPSGAWEELLHPICTLGTNLIRISLQKEGEVQSIPFGTLVRLMDLGNLQDLFIGVDCNIPTEANSDQLFHQLCVLASKKTSPLRRLHLRGLSGNHMSLSSLWHVAKYLPHL